MRTLCLTAALALVACDDTVYWGDLRGGLRVGEGGASGASGWAGSSPEAGGSATGGSATGGAPTGGSATGGIEVPSLTSLQWETPCPGRSVESDSEPEGCLPGQSFASQGVPTDTLIVLDRSAGMSEPLPPGGDLTLTRWEGVLRGITAFVNGELGNVDATLGLTLFGGPIAEDTVCDAEQYVEPAVAFDDTKEAFMAVLEKLKLTQPAGDRPLLAALQGALSYVQSEPDPLRVKSVVLVTSGPASACEESIDRVAEVASAANAAGVRTYVVQLGADFYLPEIAEAGGTESPFVIGQGNVSADIYDILHSLYFKPWMSCEFPVEEWAEAGVLQTQQLGLVFRYAWGRLVVPFLDSAAECGVLGGAYFDDPEDPRAVRLCECSCAEMAEATQVDILRCYPAL